MHTPLSMRRRPANASRVRLVFFALLLPALVAALPSRLAACAACSCTVSRDWDAQGVSSRQGFSLDLSFDLVNQDQLWYGSHRASTGISADALSRYSARQTIPVSTESSRPYAQQIINNGVNNNEDEGVTATRTYNLGLSYTAETWSVSVFVPFLNRYHTSNMTPTTIIPGIAYSYDMPASPQGFLHATSNYSAMGDARILGRYSGFSSDQSWGFLYGIKLPTGNTGFTFNDGSSLDRSLQPGTGSTDILAGAYFTGSIEKVGWFAQGMIQHPVQTTGDFRPGDAVSANLGIRYGSYGQTAIPMLQMNYISRRPDTGTASTFNETTGACSDYTCIVLSGGVNPRLPTANGGRYSHTDIYGHELTGGQLLYLAPGLSLRLGGDTSAYGFVQIPVYQNVNSLQLTARYILSAGIRHYLQ